MVRLGLRLKQPRVSAIPEVFPPHVLCCAAAVASVSEGPRPIRQTSVPSKTRQTSHSTSADRTVIHTTPATKATRPSMMRAMVRGFISGLRAHVGVSEETSTFQKGPPPISLVEPSRIGAG